MRDTSVCSAGPEGRDRPQDERGVMKFGLLILLLASIPLGFGCKSEDRGPEVSAAPSHTDPALSGVGGIGGVSHAAAAETESRPVGEKGPAYLMRFVDYRSNLHFELVNESHTSRVDLNSKVRTDPSRKVTNDDWMAGLIQYLGEQGWSKEVKQGSAPSMAKGSLNWSLQITGPDGTSYIASAPNMKGAQLERLIAMRDAFLKTYNATLGLQAVKAQPGTLPFKVPDYPYPKAPKKKGG